MCSTNKLLVVSLYVIDCADALHTEPKNMLSLHLHCEVITLEMQRFIKASCKISFKTLLFTDLILFFDYLFLTEDLIAKVHAETKIFACKRTNPSPNIALIEKARARRKLHR